MGEDRGEVEARETAAREIARLLVTPADLRESSLRNLREGLAQKRAVEEMRIRGLQSSRLDQASVGYILGRNCSLWSQLLKRYAAVDEVLGSSQVGVALRNDAVKRVNRALWNVYSVLFLMKFYRNVQAETQALADDVTVAADPELYDIYVRLVILERMRELAVLDATSLVNETNYFKSLFHKLTMVRTTMEARLWSILRGVRAVASTNASSVVAAVRIVESEEAEDRWWKDYAASVNMEEAFALRSLRHARERTFREIRQGIRNRISTAFNSVEKAPDGSDAAIRTNLRVASELVKDLDCMKKDVKQCFPADYEIDRLFIREYNELLMARLSALLNSSTQISDASYVRIIDWYAEYRMKLQENETHESDIELRLSERDRETLMAQYQKYFKEVMTRMVEKIIRSMQDSDDTGFITLEKGRSYRATKGPEDIFGLVRYQIREGALVSDGEVLSEHAESIGDILIHYAQEIMKILEGTGAKKPSTQLLAAATNDASRCLEYSEELKESMYGLLEERFHEKVDQFERVVDCFYTLERKAKDVILESMFADVAPQVSKLFQRSTGTEIVLDIVETLRDYLLDFESSLIEYHFREITLSCMERLVDGYLTSFADANNVTDVNSAAVLVQLNKDMSNLEGFFSQFAKKRLLEVRVAPFNALHNLFTCLPSVGAVRNAYANLGKMWSDCNPQIVERVLQLRPEVDKNTYDECVQACMELYARQLNALSAEGSMKSQDDTALAPSRITRRRHKQVLEWRMGSRARTKSTK